MDRFSTNFIDVLHALKSVSSCPIVPHQYPIVKDERIGRANFLEPSTKIEIKIPSEFTSKVLQLVSGKRGQLLGSDWQTWDKITAYLPQAENFNFIVEL